jgi:CRP-like cAMP-binding protein
MVFADKPIPKPRNRLLAALPAAELAQLWPRFEPVELELRQVLHLPEQPIGTVYFPESGWISMVAALEDGDTAEVGLVGREGMAGLPILHEDTLSDLEAMVQQPGKALRLSSADFRIELDRLPTFRTLLLRYSLAQHMQVARTAACNGRHAVDQRLARWLLMAHDRSDGDSFAMTHEFLGMMLGIRRAGVTVAAGMLQQAGLIRYTRGQMLVADRPGLESAACECYGISRRAFDRLFHPDAGARDGYRR